LTAETVIWLNKIDSSPAREKKTMILQFRLVYNCSIPDCATNALSDLRKILLAYSGSTYYLVVP